MAASIHKPLMIQGMCCHPLCRSGKIDDVRAATRNSVAEVRSAWYGY